MLDRVMQRLDKRKRAQYIYCQSRHRAEAIQMAEYLLAHVRSFEWECDEDYEKPWEEDGSWCLRVIVYQ